MKKVSVLVALLLFLTACNAQSALTSVTVARTAPTRTPVTVVRTAPTLTPGPTPTETLLEDKIPAFEHIIMIMFENRDYRLVIGNKTMPVFNQLAAQNVLLTNYYAVAHPSLPNYIALMGGDTFGIIHDCTDCFINQPSLPDLIEASGRTWRDYQEDIPSPCFLGNSGKYVQKHNPFIYFDPIRKNAERCNENIVSTDELDKDLAANRLPNFAFIMPNICNSAHSCSTTVADQWLGQVMQKLQGSAALGKNYLIYIAFEEASSDDSSCCGLPAKAGGRVPAILVSPQAKSGYQEDTPLSHYSLLKTFLLAWKLPELGFTANSATLAITSPWK
jgi:phospholipase C